MKITKTLILRGSESILTNAGFRFIWGYNAFECCVKFNGSWIGTFRTPRGYAIPRVEILNEIEYIQYLNSEMD